MHLIYCQGSLTPRFSPNLPKVGGGGGGAQIFQGKTHKKIKLGVLGVQLWGGVGLGWRGWGWGPSSWGPRMEWGRWVWERGGGGGFGASVSPLGEVFYGARCVYTGKVTQPWLGGGRGEMGPSRAPGPAAPKVKASDPPDSPLFPITDSPSLLPPPPSPTGAPMNPSTPLTPHYSLSVFPCPYGPSLPPCFPPPLFQCSHLQVWHLDMRIIGVIWFIRVMGAALGVGGGRSLCSPPPPPQSPDAPR